MSNSYVSPSHPVARALPKSNTFSWNWQDIRCADVISPDDLTRDSSFSLSAWQAQGPKKKKNEQGKKMLYSKIDL